MPTIIAKCVALKSVRPAQARLSRSMPALYARLGTQGSVNADLLAFMKA